MTTAAKLAQRSPEGTAAHDQLARALVALAAQGERPRCGDSATHRLWTSDSPEDRQLAATWCNGCLVLTECGTAAEATGERFGVWGGVDRSPRQQQRRTAA